MLAFVERHWTWISPALADAPDLECAAGGIWRKPGMRWPQFALNEPFDGMPATTANGSQISFLCASRGEVDTAWNTAVGHSATDAGKPGLRPQYAADFYAAYCLDPEGHKLCFVHTDS